MLLLLLGLGVITAESIEPGTGVVTVPAGLTAVVKPTTAANGASSGIPLPAIVITQPIDPSDETQISFDYTQWLAEDEKITDIDLLTVLPGGVALGLEIDVRTSPEDRRPIIDPSGKKIGVHLLINDAFRANAAFSGIGTKMGVAAKIRTNATPANVFERTAVITGQQQ